MTAQLYFIETERWACKCIQGTLSIQKIWPWSFLHTVKKCHSHPYHRMFPSSLLIAWVVLLSLVVLKTVQIMQRWKNIRLSYTFLASCPFPLHNSFASWDLCRDSRREHWQEAHFIVILQNIVGLKVLSLTLEHFYLVILYSTDVNVFNFIPGFALFSVFPLYSL